MKLNYIFPPMTTPVECSFNENLDHTWSWLHAVVKENPEINFFFTVETTDIWEDDETVRLYADNILYKELKKPAGVKLPFVLDEDEVIVDLGNGPQVFRKGDKL